MLLWLVLLDGSIGRAVIYLFDLFIFISFIHQSFIRCSPSLQYINRPALHLDRRFGMGRQLTRLRRRNGRCSMAAALHRCAAGAAARLASCPKCFEAPITLCGPWCVYLTPQSSGAGHCTAQLGRLISFGQSHTDCISAARIDVLFRACHQDCL